MLGFLWDVGRLDAVRIVHCFIFLPRDVITERLLICDPSVQNQSHVAENMN